MTPKQEINAKIKEQRAALKEAKAEARAAVKAEVAAGKKLDKLLMEREKL